MWGSCKNIQPTGATEKEKLRKQRPLKSHLVKTVLQLLLHPRSVAEHKTWEKEVVVYSTDNGPTGFISPQVYKSM